MSDWETVGGNKKKRTQKPKAPKAPSQQAVGPRASGGQQRELSVAVRMALKSRKGDLEAPDEHGFFSAVTDVSLPKSVRKEQAAAERREAEAAARKKKAHKAKAARADVAVPDAREALAAVTGAAATRELEAIRAEYPEAPDACLLRVAEVIHAWCAGAAAVADASAWDAPLAYVHADVRSALLSFLRPIPQHACAGLLELVVAEPPSAAIQMCAQLCALQWPLAVLRLIEAQPTRHVRWLVAVADAAPADALRVALQSDALMEREAVLVALAQRVPRDAPLDHGAVVGPRVAQLVGNGRVALWRQLEGAIQASPEVVEALLPFAVVPEVQEEAMASLSAMLERHPPALRSWARAHPLHIAASTNLLRFVGSRPVRLDAAAVEQLVEALRKTQVAKQRRDVHAAALEAAQALLVRSRARASGFGVWKALLVVLVVGGALAGAGATLLATQQ